MHMNVHKTKYEVSKDGCCTDRAALRRTLAEGRARRAMREGHDVEPQVNQKALGHALCAVVIGRCLL
jgi:hypothetical protein